MPMFLEVIFYLHHDFREHVASHAEAMNQDWAVRWVGVEELQYLVCCNLRPLGGPEQIEGRHSHFEHIDAQVGVELGVFPDVPLLGHEPAEEQRQWPFSLAQRSGDLHGLLRKGRVAGSEEFHISGKPESVEVPAQDEGHRRRIALGR